MQFTRKRSKEDLVFVSENILVQPGFTTQSRIYVLFFCELCLFCFQPILYLFLGRVPELHLDYNGPPNQLRGSRQWNHLLAAWGRPMMHLYFAATKTPRSLALSEAGHEATYCLTRSDLWGEWKTLVFPLGATLGSLLRSYFALYLLTL